MATLMSHTTGGRLPEDGALERLVAKLEAVGSAVGVVRLVERWAEHRPPTRAALLAECRAFVNLRLMDRAWVRLRELSEADASDVEVQALIAEMFIARGWPARANRLLEKLQALGLSTERLRLIEEGASAPPVRPPSNAREIERGGSIEQQISLAETFLATGSMLRARGLLERLGRTHGAHPRVQQLLWGLRGEFTAGQQHLSALVTELQAGLSSDIPGWDASEPTASLDNGDPETAEASKVMHGWQPATPERQGAFSGLFRMDATDVDDDDDLEDDVTVAAVMASHEEMVDPPTFEHSDPDGVIASSSGDTQIMQVIGSGDNRRLAPVSGQVHEKRPEKRGPVDLRKWRADHGVAPPTSLLDSPTIDSSLAYDDDDFLEEEDEDVVVMTRQEESAVDPRTPMVRRVPISVIEKVPVPPPPIPNLPGQDEETPTVQPSPVPAAAPLVAAPEPEPEPEPGPPEPALGDDLLDFEPRPGRSNLTTLLLVAAGLVAVVGLLIGVVGRRAVTSSAQSATVRQAILDSRPDELLKLRTELRAMVDEDGLFAPTSSHVAARLVLVDLALWEVVSGDPAVLDEARQLAGEGLGGPEADLAVAWLERVADTPIGLGNPGGDPLVALLLAEEALDARDATAAARALDGISVDAGVRIAMADIRIRDEAGSVTTDAIPLSVSQHPLGRLWLYSGGDPSLSETERLGYLQALRKSLPADAAKLVAQTHLAEAEVHAQAGRSEAAASSREEALTTNPNDPTVLALVAADQRSPGQSVKLLRRCIALLATSPGCQRGLVQVHVEEGNVSRAKALVESWKEAGVGVGQLGEWVDLERGDLDARPGAASAADPHRAGREFIRYLDALSQKTKGSRQNGLAKAHAGLSASASPWDQRLARYIDREKDRLVVPPKP